MTQEIKQPQIDGAALQAAHAAMRGKPVCPTDNAITTLRLGIETFLSNLPKPSLPYDQALQYRKMTGME